jgi:hypothetical protein
METIDFEGSSKLKRIGERAFMGCKLHSFTIPALTEEIDGSASVNCPLISLEVAPGSQNFKIEGNLLVTSDGPEIVRYFGQDREILVDRNVKVLGRSCFEACQQFQRVDFKHESELQQIGLAALRDCIWLVSIDIPESVTIIDERSFEGCTELESCFSAPDSSLVTIDVRAFAKCTSLRSFYIPQLVAEISSNCFNECIYLYQLQFQSSESLPRVVADRLLDDALDEFGVSESCRLFKIEVEDEGLELNLPGLVSAYIDGDDGDLRLTFVRDVQ